MSTLRGPAQLADLQGALCVPTYNFTNAPVYHVNPASRITRGGRAGLFRAGRGGGGGVPTF